MRNILFGLLIIFAFIGTFPSLSLGQGGSGEGSSWYPGESDKGWAGTWRDYTVSLYYYHERSVVGTGFWQDPRMESPLSIRSQVTVGTLTTVRSLLPPDFDLDIPVGGGIGNVAYYTTVSISGVSSSVGLGMLLALPSGVPVNSSGAPMGYTGLAPIVARGFGTSAEDVLVPMSIIYSIRYNNPNTGKTEYRVTEIESYERTFSLTGNQISTVTHKFKVKGPNSIGALNRLFGICYCEACCECKCICGLEWILNPCTGSCKNDCEVCSEGNASVAPNTPTCCDCHCNDCECDVCCMCKCTYGKWTGSYCDGTCEDCNCHCCE